MRRVFAVVGLLVGGGLLVTPAQAGGGCHGTGRSAGQGATVELSMNCMSPRVLRAPAGTEVSFVNRDGVKHNLVGDDWNVSELSSGETHRRAFAVGTHVYSCTLHPGMVGAVAVGDGVVAPIASVGPRSPAQSSDWWLLSGVVGLGLGAAASLGLRRILARS